jgi:hypothetical protein
MQPLETSEKEQVPVELKEQDIVETRKLKSGPNTDRVQQKSGRKELEAKEGAGPVCLRSRAEDENENMGEQDEQYIYGYSR